MTQQLATAIPPIRRLLRKLYHFFWYSLAILIILIAVAISLARIFLPEARGYRVEVEKFASTAMGREVKIASMDARLDGLTPTFIFHDVHMFDAHKRHELLHFDQARIGFDVLRSLARRKPVPASLTISGVELAVTRDKQGKLSIQGIAIADLEQTMAEAPTTTTDKDELSSWFFERSRLVVEKSRIIWRDEYYGLKNILFSNVNVSLRNDKQRHQLTGNVNLPADLGEGLSVAIDFTGNILIPAEWQGQFFAAGKHIQAGNLGAKLHLLHMVLHEGAMDFQVWGGWKQQGFAALSGNVTISDVKLTSRADANPFKLRLLNSAFDWTETPQGWQLRVEDFRYQQAEEVWPATSFAVNYINQAQPIVIGYTSLIKLRDARNLLTLSGLLSKANQDTLNEIQPRGELQDLFIQFQPGEDRLNNFQFSSRFDNLSSQPWEKYPGIKNLRGQVWLDSQNGHVQLDSRMAELNFSDMFRAPLAFAELQMRAQWWHEAGDLQIKVEQLQANNQDLHADATMQLQVPGATASPYMDLQLHFADVNAASLKQYYPVGIMDKSLVAWLDTGIVSGKVTDGGLVMRGQLKDFPFEKPSGVFQVKFSAADIDMNYQQGWPHLTQMPLDAEFSGTGMVLHADQAGLFDSHLQDVQVTIDDFSQAVLQATGKYHGHTRDLIHFLVASPIAANAEDFYNASKFDGKGAATLQLQVPLVERLAGRFPLDYHGKVKLTDSSMHSWDGKLLVDNLNGELEYSPQGLSGSNITAKIFGGKTTASVFTYNQDTSQQIKIAFNGELEMQRVLQQYKLPITARITGRTRWAGLLGFGYKQGGVTIPGNFSIDSDLAGVALDLPAPLQKSKAETRHFNMQVQFPRDGLMGISVSLDSILRSKAVLNTRGQRDILHKATINFSDAEPVLPEQRALTIGGRLQNFEPQQWQSVLGADTAKNTQAKPTTGTGLPVLLDMDYLSLHTGDTDATTVPAKPMDVALVNGVINELVIDGMQLGRFEVATQRVKEGLRFDKLNFTSAAMNVNGSGSWLYRKRRHQTNIRFDLDSPNVGNMLERLGYSHTIRHGKAQAHLQLNWPDAPEQFSFEHLGGTVGVVIKDGSIAEVEPGAGRLLGLLSLSELPRHLLLNFKEFGSGMSFDEIRGSFDINDGIAKTDDLNVNTPVAVIGIRGQMGLSAHDYDLSVLAVPRVTSSLTLISCLLTGGSTCGWVFFFDRVAGKKLDDSLAKRYTITGAWEHPEVKERGNKTTPAAAEADKE